MPSLRRLWHRVFGHTEPWMSQTSYDFATNAVVVPTQPICGCGAQVSRRDDG